MRRRHDMSALRQLILWRHAEAEEVHEDISDRARQLTPKGRKQAVRMGLWLGGHLPEKTHVLVSPAVRTMQTADGLGHPYQVVESLAPERGVEELWQAVLESGSANVLVVGHQPTLGLLAAWLMSGETQAWSVKKGAIWWFSVEALQSRPRVKLLASLGPDLLPQ